MQKTITRRLLATCAGAAAAIALFTAGAVAQTADKPIVLQWQTANLTEKQFEPVWKEMIAEFEKANPGVKVEPVLVARKDHWTKFVTSAQARRASCPSISRPPRITAISCRSTPTGKRSRKPGARRGRTR